MPYTIEEKDIIKSEQKKISQLIPEKIELTIFPEFDLKIKIIIDTDLGTDWNDAMVLIYTFNIPHIEILGIKTKSTEEKNKSNIRCK